MRFFLEPRDQPVDRLLEVAHFDRGLVLARGQKGRLVDEVREIGARESGGPGRHDLQIDVGRHGDRLRVDPQNLFAAAHVRLVDKDLPIEPARSQQGRVQHLRADWSPP